MSKTKTLLIAGLAAGTIALGGAALAERGQRGEHGAGAMVERITSRLSLDDNQSAALQSFADALQESRGAIGGEKGGPRAQLLPFLDGDTLDQGGALAAIESRADAMRAAAPELVSSAAAFYDGLNAEQQEQIRSFLERGGRGRGRH